MKILEIERECILKDIYVKRLAGSENEGNAGYQAKVTGLIGMEMEEEVNERV